MINPQNNIFFTNKHNLASINGHTDVVKLLLSNNVSQLMLKLK
jgi:hypothetical protein